MKINLEINSELKNELGLIFLRALNRLNQTRFSQAIYVETDEDGLVTGFDFIPDVHSRGKNVVAVIQQDIEGDWDRDEEGNLEETDENIEWLADAILNEVEKKIESHNEDVAREVEMNEIMGIEV